jgi:Na+/H+-dicarboxylate symporter
MLFLAVYSSGAVIFVISVYFFLLVPLRLMPWRVFASMRNALGVAMATRSSATAFPAALQDITLHLGVDTATAQLVMPLTTALNCSGLILLQSLSVFYVAQAYELTLDTWSVALLVAMSTLAAIGSGGRPGAGFLQSYILFSTVDIPQEGFSLLLPCAVLCEMIAAAVALLGNGCCTLYVAARTGALDERIFRRLPIDTWENSAV